MNFNLEEYEPVKERKKRFYSDHPDGRIVVESVTTNPLEYAFFKALVFFNAGDQEHNLPRATGYALELRDKEKKLNKYGKEYESVNYTSWTENCEESAVGRALDNAGYASLNKASREEMAKAQRMGELLSDDKPFKFPSGPYKDKTFDEVPTIELMVFMQAVEIEHRTFRCADQLR